MAISNHLTKAYVDSTVSGANWRTTRPKSPSIGDAYFCSVANSGWIWSGSEWVTFSDNPEKEFKVPTEEQLEKHPALKEAWEEFLVVKKLIGI